MSELKCCPFCGGEPTDHPTKKGFVICGENDCPSTRFMTREQWNTRASGWVSVKERMPEIGNQKALYSWSKHVLCLLNDKTIHVMVLTDLGSWQNFEGKYSVQLESVTHWQPLPEPPKDE